MIKKKVKKITVDGIKYELNLGIIIPVNIKSNYNGVYDYFSKKIKEKLSEMNLELAPVQFTIQPNDKRIKDFPVNAKLITSLQFYLVENIEEVLKDMPNKINVEDVEIKENEEDNVSKHIENSEEIKQEGNV